MWRSGLCPGYEPTFFDRYFLTMESAETGIPRLS